MSIYIVKNESNEEVAAYSNSQLAEREAEEFQSATLQHHRVEKLISEHSGIGQSPLDINNN